MHTTKQLKSLNSGFWAAFFVRSIEYGVRSPVFGTESKMIQSDAEVFAYPSKKRVNAADANIAIPCFDRAAIRSRLFG